MEKYCLSPIHPGQYTSIMSTVTDSFEENDHQNYLRKRRGSYPQIKSTEILSGELLAPLPQANISRTPSTMFDDETQPLLKVTQYIQSLK